MKTHIELNDVQAHILRSAKPSAAVYLALSIVNVPAFLGLLERLKPHMHPESRIREALAREHTRDLSVPLLANLGLSFSGLQKLGLHPAILDCFPTPFQQGMAARAAFIGDIGDDAPERWQGNWGHTSVNAFLAIYYLSDQVAAGQRNGNADPHRIIAGLIDDLHLANQAESGVVVLARETAQVLRQQGRSVEHFGFKDGVSQPYVNDGLAPHAGGGKKNSQEDWQPLATGEFLLGYPDELRLISRRPADNQCAAAKSAGDNDNHAVNNDNHESDRPLPLPGESLARAYAELTRNGSFLVYRKIEQDVAGFRTNIVKKLGMDVAELMVGRRQDGAALGNQNGSTAVRKNNGFDFSDDRDGHVCPAGAHIRRSNPRTSLDASDTRGTRDVDQHRLIRRGMAYGPWLEEDANGPDGIERGLHFLCYNANIENQFEFVQRTWINNSDFFGCPTAMVDPVVGSIAHAPLNPFVAPSLPLPLMGLPALTRVRGGDYFFVPGINGLSRLIALSRQATPGAEVVVPDTAPVTDPFDVPRILGRAQIERNIFHTTMPVTLADGTSSTYHYFAHPQDVKQILGNPVLFGNQHYRRRIQALTGQDMLLSMPPGQERTQLKNEMAALLISAGVEESAKAAFLPTLKAQLRQFALAGNIDLVDGLARQMPLAMVKNFLGIAAPAQFPSEAEIAAFYDRTCFDTLPPAWREHYREYGLNPSADATLLFWIRMLFLEVFGNLWNVPYLTELAKAAGKEFAVHLAACVDEALAHPGEQTVLQRLARFYQAQTHLSDEERKGQIQQRILEFVVGSTDTTMKAIATTVSVLLQKAPTLEAAVLNTLSAPEYAAQKLLVTAFLKGGSLPDATQEKALDAILDAIVMKILKLVPVAPILSRGCEFGAVLKLADGQTVAVAPGSTVVTVLQVASALSLKQPSPDMPDFVFLDPWSAHGCMGKPLALLQVREVLKGLLSLKQVRTAAGQRGIMIEKYRLPAYQLLRCESH